uniref:Uncharacterized protein n=1 Tax=Octopus bimaculoides TaxID=37653 RepID=A0A0L8FZU2_OCTBM
MQLEFGQEKCYNMAVKGGKTVTQTSNMKNVTVGTLDLPIRTPTNIAFILSHECFSVFVSFSIILACCWGTIHFSTNYTTKLSTSTRIAVIFKCFTDRISFSFVCTRFVTCFLLTIHSPIRSALTFVAIIIPYRINFITLTVVITGTQNFSADNQTIRFTGTNIATDFK